MYLLGTLCSKGGGEIFLREFQGWFQRKITEDGELLDRFDDRFAVFGKMLDNLDRVGSSEEHLKVITVNQWRRSNRMKLRRTRASVSSLVGLLVLASSAPISLATKLRFSIFIVVAGFSPCVITKGNRSAIPSEQSIKRTVGIVPQCQWSERFSSRNRFNCPVF